MEIAELIASNIKQGELGLLGIYLIGTVFNKSASVGSDIDLLVHYDGKPENKEKLEIWFDAWNKSLSEMLIDVIYITDDDILENEYYANLVNNTKEHSKKLILGE